MVALPADCTRPSKVARTDVRASDVKARKIATVGFLGISDYGFGQLQVLADRYHVIFATGKAKQPKHAEGMDKQLEDFCLAKGILFIGAVDANSEAFIQRARSTDLLVIGGYDKILHGPVLEAPRHGVINTHLGVLPLNRGCCPTMWAQLHGLRQGFTTYRVNVAIDHGEILECSDAGTELGALNQTNREVYDRLAAEAVARFGLALDRLESSEVLPCKGQEAYHRAGLPNDSWLSFHWSNKFLKRFSLSLDFSPYLPGKCYSDSSDAPLFLAIEGDADNVDPEEHKCIGEVLKVWCCADNRDCIMVRTSSGAVTCTIRGGVVPAVGQVLQSVGDAGVHPISRDFAGEVLPLDRYLVAAPGQNPRCTRSEPKPA